MNKEYLTYENKILGQEVERLAKEVERLEKVNQMLLNSMVTEAHTKETKEIERLKNINEEHRILNGELRKELQEKENIIKEAREYIEERYNGEVLTHTFDKDNVGELLEILGSDKE